MGGARKLGTVALAVLGALALAGAALGADLIEPWEPGPSDLELFASFERGARPTVSTLVGFGFGSGLSAGLSLAGGEEPADVGFVLVWTRGLGRWGELDLFAEASSAAREVELAGLGTAYGFEWSGAGEAAARPYFRLHVAEEGTGWRVHPLVGWNLPFERVDLHLEISSEEPEPGGDWPLHLAIGPNLALGDGCELVPELSLLASGGRVEAGVTVGIVTSPAALRAAIDGGRRR